MTGAEPSRIFYNPMAVPPPLFKCECPNCQQAMEAPPELHGQVIECPTCQMSLQLPAAPRKPVPRPIRQPTHRPQRRKEEGPLPLTLFEKILMMWPMLTAITWGHFFNGPRAGVEYYEASDAFDYAMKTLWPALGLALFCAVNAIILQSRQPMALKILLTTLVGIAALLTWPYIGHEPIAK